MSETKMASLVKTNVSAAINPAKADIFTVKEVRAIITTEVKAATDAISTRVEATMKEENGKLLSHVASGLNYVVSALEK